MTDQSHQSAAPLHYDEVAEKYDTLNEEHSQVINRILDNILKQHGVKTVFDMTCGTGSQVFWLARQGYRLTGSDISVPMLIIWLEKKRSHSSWM